MKTAKEIFEMYPEANWLAKNANGSIFAYKKEPDCDDCLYYRLEAITGRLLVSSKLDIAEFQGKHWTECKISREEVFTELNVCIWNPIDAEFELESTRYLTTCNNSALFDDDGKHDIDKLYNYCPYCGRKIKVEKK